MSAAMSSMCLTVSNAFDRTIAFATVHRGGGRSLLKPFATLSASGNRAEVVDLCLRKPCWVSDRWRCRLKYGRCQRSRTLMAGQRKEIGW